MRCTRCHTRDAQSVFWNPRTMAREKICAHCDVGDMKWVKFLPPVGPTAGKQRRGRWPWRRNTAKPQ